MDLVTFTGTFVESGIWYTDSGHRGPLESVIRIIATGNDLQLLYEDGSRHAVTGAASGLGRFELQGNNATGTLFIGAQTLLFDYSADIEGRIEHNVDVWTFTDHGITRSGIIRQPERTIWFEAVMTREAAGD
jgi:hypothetical protein